MLRLLRFEMWWIGLRSNASRTQGFPVCYMPVKPKVHPVFGARSGLARVFASVTASAVWKTRYSSPNFAADKHRWKSARRAMSAWESHRLWRSIRCHSLWHRGYT